MSPPMVSFLENFWYYPPWNQHITFENWRLEVPLLFFWKMPSFQVAGMVQSNGKTPFCFSFFVAPVLLFHQFRSFHANSAKGTYSCIWNISQAFMYLLENHGGFESSQKLVFFCLKRDTSWTICISKKYDSFDMYWEKCKRAHIEMEVKVKWTSSWTRYTQEHQTNVHHPSSAVVCQQLLHPSHHS